MKWNWSPSKYSWWNQLSLCRSSCAQFQAARKARINKMKSWTTWWPCSCTRSSCRRIAWSLPLKSSKRPTRIWWSLLRTNSWPRTRPSGWRSASCCTRGQNRLSGSFWWWGGNEVPRTGFGLLPFLVYLLFPIIETIFFNLNTDEKVDDTKNNFLEY